MATATARRTAGTATAAAAAGPDPAVLAAARSASALLSSTDAAAQRRWAALSNEALAREVETCRRDIRALAAALAALGGGDAGGGEEEEDSDRAAAAAAAGAAAARAATSEEEAAAVPHAAAAAAVAAATAGRNNDGDDDGDDGDDGDDDDDARRRASPDLPSDGRDHRRKPAAAASLPSNDPFRDEEWRVPPHCIPIHANVTTFDWARLASAAQFDVVMMDPPWQLATANPTRGVALGYSQLADADITALPVPDLQRRGGLLLVWVINAKYKFALDLFDAWGYSLVDEVVWVKSTVNRRLAKSHGYYLQHAKETCLVAFKGAAAAGATADAATATVTVADTAAAGTRSADWSSEDGRTTADPAAPPAPPPRPLPPSDPAPPMPWEIAAASRMQRGGGAFSVVGSDVIFSERRGQSQKPEEVYELVEALVPGGRYLELFARRNNLRDFWTSVGNEVTGTGLPPEDLAAMAAGQVPGGAVYGRAPG